MTQQIVQELGSMLVLIWMMLAGVGHVIGGQKLAAKVITVPLGFLKRQVLRLLRFLFRKLVQLLRFLGRQGLRFLKWLLRLLFVRFPPALWRGLVRLKTRIWP